MHMGVGSITRIFSRLVTESAPAMCYTAHGRASMGVESPQTTPNYAHRVFSARPTTFMNQWAVFAPPRALICAHECRFYGIFSVITVRAPQQRYGTWACFNGL